MPFAPQYFHKIHIHNSASIVLSDDDDDDDDDISFFFFDGFICTIEIINMTICSHICQTLTKDRFSTNIGLRSNLFPSYLNHLFN